MWRRTEPSTFWYILIQHKTECNQFLQVFGEALLNDGVTFVLYEGVKELAFVQDDNIEEISVFITFIMRHLCPDLILYI